MNNLCFVLMPFGQKPDPSGRVIDFDAVYQDIIRPAIVDAGLEPIRADEEKTGGIIHKPMFERLLLCAYAVADLTSANANVLYELGIRHAVRPYRTVSMFAEGSRLPFDISYLRSLPYGLSAAGVPANAAADRAKLAAALETARRDAVAPSVDSPVFQLLGYLTPPAVDHEKTDLFREQTRYSEQAKAAFARARADKTQDAVDKVLATLRPVGDLEVGVLVDAMLSYRDVKAYKRMIELIESFPAPVRETLMVQEQLGFALNRDHRDDEAEQVLRAVLAKFGKAPETLGILGRVYKDRWKAAFRAGKRAEANAILDDAIDVYRQGFESDWRDAYPGVNAATLMEIRSPRDPAGRELVPIVRFAVERKMAARGADYWDYASLIELAIIEENEAAVAKHLGPTLVRARVGWEASTTVENLAMLRQARAEHGITLGYADNVERALVEKAKELG